MPFRIRPGRAAALLLSAALVAGGLSGCSFLTPFKTCEGTEARMKELESLPLLASPPPGASLPRTFDGVYAECADDSGDAWLSAGRTYVYPGTRQEVLDHYRGAAEADGWRFVPAPTFARESGDVCFTKGEDGQAKTFTVSFPPARFMADFYGPEAAAEFATGSGFELTAGSEADGATTSCWS
ncbi:MULTISPECIES: hypothetical protein [Streptomyces]|uniref:hypothetical protein n=1 Tax=Streptomyces TaxID=1883 RepID=UPI000691D179|nr:MULTISPECIES: hypothetical protein [Streptomyces]MCX5271506.1 hypothetical protein [Streptomyces virginiae]MYV76419.1 hypothetical protein [Streptomyces sp. SID1046]